MPYLLLLLATETHAQQDVREISSKKHRCQPKRSFRSFLCIFFPALGACVRSGDWQGEHLALSTEHPIRQIDVQDTKTRNFEQTRVHTVDEMMAERKGEAKGKGEAKKSTWRHGRAVKHRCDHDINPSTWKRPMVDTGSRSRAEYSNPSRQHWFVARTEREQGKRGRRITPTHFGLCKGHEPDLDRTVAWHQSIES